MLTVLIDYESGNLHSAEKAFQRMASETGAGEVIVSSSPEDVARADRLVLPGDGAFPACLAGLKSYDGLFEAMTEAVEQRGVPFMGILRRHADVGELGAGYEDTRGFDWIAGDVARIVPDTPSLKVPLWDGTTWSWSNRTRFWTA